MDDFVRGFGEIDHTHLPDVGGKGANLGEMTRAGLPVPPGFCVTTSAYRSFAASSPKLEELLRLLEQARYDDLERIGRLGQEIREHLTSIPMPGEIAAAIIKAWESAGRDRAYAVRSSATAEDLPSASFAGQQDTYLNVVGAEQLLQAVQRCWASLFTDRAISYRAKNGFSHRAVLLSVVVQQMVFPDVSGIMFTADPVTGRRDTVSIDASFGLGEALVSGLVTADLYQVRADEIVLKKISKKEQAIYAAAEGGTVTRTLPPEERELQALPDEKIVELARLGRRIEAHYGAEQDIEWALAGGHFFILQSRPITSLYPLPQLKDSRFRVLINLGYIQMMTDPMKPLALSVLSHITDFVMDAPDLQIITNAGGRFFIDLTGPLSVKRIRRRLLTLLSRMDEMIASALSEAVEREEFPQEPPSRKAIFRVVRNLLSVALPATANVMLNRYVRDPGKAKARAEAFMDEIVLDTRERVEAAAGAERLRIIRRGIGRIVPDVIAKIVVHLIAGMLASGELERLLKERAGGEQAASLLSRLYKSLPGNVTTEMGLALGDLADTARELPDVAACLQQAEGEGFYERLRHVPGGSGFLQELDRFLSRYGMRGAGEIDITKPRWYEDPSQLISSIVSNMQTSSPGGHRAKFKQGEADAEEAAREIVRLFRSGRERRKAARLVRLYRYLMGMREHHKFALIRLMDVYKRAILAEARELVRKGVFHQPEDAYYFSLEELTDMLEDRFPGNLRDLAENRRQQHELNIRLKSPRVMTSLGEMISGKPRDAEAPAGALLGTPVSAGVVEGIARVVVSLEDARLNAGEILVAPYTDPGWTPLFTSAAGLVTEVGGMMTHGSVIAREYGIPAVVGIEGATGTIQDGDRIRVDGTNGFVQILKQRETMQDRE
ncbi:phosphoenolpyruvate synthase [Paenibacillus humicola]|uniref:phosphoenolpyruvate synthase n=1 Tax=Paenibacillus humicola TaxID=3110540 RepID=UPI00237B1DC0|nr:phosphoenolpyruvate synthase [Paenibacillus humicola]